MHSDPDIPAERVAAFVRQHTHDVRNGLNGLDLEAALVQEIVTDEEARESLARMRAQVRALAEQMRALAGRFRDPQPHLAPLAARELLAVFREQNAGLPAALEISWDDELGGESVRVDVGMLADLFRELLVNAVAFPSSGPIAVRARCEAEGVLFELSEPKAKALDVAGWGAVPFSSGHRGGYGLGLWTARRIAEANGLALTREFSSAGNLVTRLRFPKD